MDATIASTQSWELLAQLAAFRQRDLFLLDQATLLEHVADVLQRALPYPWGMLVARTNGNVHSSTSWGLEQKAQDALLNLNGTTPANTLVLPFGANADDNGYLVVPVTNEQSNGFEPGFLQAVAAQIGLLLDVQQRHHAEHLAAALQHLASVTSMQMPLVDLLDLMLTQLATVLSFDRAQLLFPDEDQRRSSTLTSQTGALRIIHTQGDPNKLALPPADDQTYRSVMMQRQAQIVRLFANSLEEQSNDHSFVIASPSVTGNGLLVPLLVGDDLTGLLVVASTTARYGRRERDAARAIADQTGHSIAANRRYTQQLQRARELFVLYENSQVISSTAQFDQMLDRVLENIALAMNADACAIGLIDPDQPNILTIAAATGIDNERYQPGQRFEISEEPELAGLLASDVPLQANNIPERFLSGNEPDDAALSLLHSFGFGSGIVLSMRTQEHPIGILGIGDVDHTRSFTRTELNLISTLTNQITTAIANAQFDAAEQRRTTELEQLQTISQQLSGDLSLEDTAQALAEGVRKLVPQSMVEVCIFDSQDGIFRVQYTAPPEMARPRRIFGYDESLTGWLGRHRRVLSLPDVQQRTPVPMVENRAPDGTPVRAYLGFPLQVGDELIGTVELVSERANAFTRRDERLMNIIAGQAARAMRAAMRYEQADEHLRWRIQQLSALQRINSQLTMGHFLSDILEFVLEQALKATTATQGYIALYNTMASTERELADGAFNVIAAEGFADEAKARMLDRPLPAGATTAQAALSNGQPELADEVSDEERRSIASPDASAVLAVPIFYEAQVVGVVALLSPIVHGFDHDAMEFVRALASQAALAIGNAQRYEDQVRFNAMLQRRATMLNSVLEIGQALRADRPLEEVLEQVGESVIDATGFRSVLFHLVDDDNPEIIRTVAGAGVPLDDLRDYSRAPITIDAALRCLDSRFRIGRSFFVPADELRAILEETHSTSRSDNMYDAIAPRVEDTLIAPLYTPYNRRLVGIMSVIALPEPLPPPVRMVEPLAIFADQAAIAIENVQLVRSARDQADQMTSLFQAGAAAASTLDLKTLLAQIYEQIMAYLGQPSHCALVSYQAEREGVAIYHLSTDTIDHNPATSPVCTKFTGWIVEQGQSLLVRDLQAEAEQLRARGIPLPDDENYRSLIAVPLYSQSRVIGVLLVQHYQTDHYNQRDVTFLSALGNILAVALENVELFQERERRIEELAIINRIGTITSSTLNLEEMLPQVYESLTKFLPIDSFYTLIHRTGRTNTMLWMMVDDNEQQVWHQTDVPAASSLSGYIIKTGKPLLFGNMAQEQRPAGVKPIPFGNTDKRSASWLGVPLVVGNNEVLGVISVQSYTPDRYGQRELSFLTTVASQLALSAQNALFYAKAQEQVDQLSLLNQVSSVAAATLEPEQIYQAAVDSMAQATNVDRAELILYDRPTGTATIVAEHAPGQESQRLTFSLLQNPIVDWMDAHQRPFIAQNAASEPLLAPFHGLINKMQLQTVAFIPLIVGREVIGTVSLDFVNREGALSDPMIELCRTIANQTATAIQNAHLFAEAQGNASAIQRKVDELSTLLDAARLLSSSLRPDEVLDYLMNLVRRQLDVNTVALWTINNGIMTPSAMEGIPPEAARTMRVPVGKGMTGQVASTSAPLIVVDVEADGQSLYPDFQRRNRLTSFMGVPVIYRERTIGVLSVMTIDRREFGADEMLLLAGLADQAAIALENARLFEQRERRINELTTFNHIGTAINAAIELPDLLAALHNGIGDVLDTSTSFIGLYDPLPQRVTFPITRINGVDYGDEEPLTLDNPDSLIAHIVLGMRPLLLRTPAEMVALSPVPPERGLNEVGSYLGVPIMTGGDVLGVIVLQSPDAFAFDSDDERFLVTVAGQAATALAKAYLFSDRERRLKEVTAFKDIGSALAGTLDTQQMLEQLHRELSNVLDVSTSLIGLYDAERDMLAFPVAYDQGKRIAIAPEPINDGPNGWVIRNQAPLLIETLELGEQMGFDLQRNTHREGTLDRFEESFLVVPIMSGDSVLGIISLQSYEQRAFNADDLRFVMTAANQAAVSLANARLFNERGRRIEELATFNEIGKALSSTVSFEELPDLIYRQTSRLLKTVNFYMALVDEKNNQITFPLYIERGQPQQVPPLRDGTSLTEYIVRTREPLLLQGDEVSNRMQQLGIVPVGDLTRSWLGVPMISSDKVIGVIGVQDYDNANAYREEDVRLLSTIASWAGTALDNARLFQNELARRTLADTLRDVAQSFTTTLALDEIQTLTINQLARLVPFDMAAVLLREEDMLRVTAAQGISDETVEQYPSFEIQSTRFFNRMADTRQPLIIADTQQSRELGGLRRYKLANGQRLRCWIGAPMLIDDELVGVLLVGSSTESIYNADQAQITFVLASQASQAIQNARLFERITNIAAELEEANTELERRVTERTSDLEAEKQRLEAVHTITLELTSTLHMDEILSKALKMVCQTIGAARGSVMLRDPQTGELICRAVLYDDGEVRGENLPISFGMGGGLAGWVMKNQEAVRIADVRRDRRWVVEPGRADEVRSVAAVPLMSNDEPLGVLVLNSPKLGFFGDSQLKLLATIANQVAIAVNNAQLYSVINDFATRMGESLMLQREEFSKTRAILQSVTEGVIVLDEERKIVLFNPAAELILGMTSEALRDKQFTSLAMQGTTEQARKRASLIYTGLFTGLETAKDRKGIYSIALELPDPTQTIAVNLAPVIGNDGRRYGDVAVLRDVTREIEAERTKRAFISGVSHELRTPLTAIKGFVDLLISGLQGPLTDAQGYSLGVIKTNSNRLMDLINDILTISSIESGKIELQMSQVEVDAVILDVVQSLKLEAERKRLTVNVSIAENLPEVTADKRRLTQVVFNLFSNAVKYTFEGGHIWVRTFLNPAGLMQVEVEDTGVGMSPDQVEKLFRPFYRADNPLREEAGGTGLGLSIAKSLIEEHSGELWPTSELGKGSTFHFVIPVQQTEASRANRDTE